MPAPTPAAAARAAPNVRPVDEAFYPSSDGRPMAENSWQSRAIVNAVADLEEARPEALVLADILVYPQEGNRDYSLAPDVLVAFGLGTHDRSSYFVWAEGKPPDWVLEVASRSTWRRDLNDKRRAYAAMGVREYWLFDAGALGRERDGRPRMKQVGARGDGTPRLQGLALADGEYRPLEARLAEGERTIRSEVLGMDVRADGNLLRFRDVATGRDVPHRPELKAAAEREAAERRAAEAHAEREAARAEREAARANREAERARREAAARSAAEDRVAELQAALRRRGDAP